MSRNFLRASALGLLAAATSAPALGQTAIIVEPVTGLFEYISPGLNAGDQTLVYFTVLGTNNLPEDIDVLYYTADGTQLVTTTNINDGGDGAGAGAIRSNDDNGDDNIDAGEVWWVDISTAVGGSLPGAAAMIGISVDPTGVDAQTVANDDGTTTGAGGGTDFSDTVDGRAELVFTRSAATAAFRDTANDLLYFQIDVPNVGFDPSGTDVLPIPFFGEQDVDGNGTPSGDSVQVGGGAGTDFEYTAGDQFNSNTGVAGAEDITPGSFAETGDPTVLEWAYDPTMTGLLGSNPFNVDQTSSTVRDSSGNLVDDDIVTPENLDDLQVVSVSWKAPVVNGGGTVADAVQVIWNRPLASAGNTTFYQFRRQDGTDPGGLNANAVAIDPDNPSAVLIDVTQPSSSSDDILNDGLPRYSDGDPNEGNINLVLDNAGTEPVPSFGSSDDPSGTFFIMDMIAPSIQAYALGDCDFNGYPESVILNMGEPIDSFSAATGIELSSIDGAETFPFYWIDTQTGLTGAGNIVGNPGNGLDIVNSATDAENVIPVETVETVDFDWNRNGVIDPIEVSSAIKITFDPLAYDWDHDGNVLGPDADGDEDEPIIDTGNASTTDGATGTGRDDAIRTILNFTGSDQNSPASGETLTSGTAGSIVDLNGNAFMTPVALLDNNADQDFAAPALLNVCYLDGENTPNSGNNDQQVCEVIGGATPSTGDVGDDNPDRMVIIAGEVFRDSGNGSIDGGDIDETNIRIGTGGTTLVNGDFLNSNPNNIVTFEPTPSFSPGDVVSVIFSQVDDGLSDRGANQLIFTDFESGDCTGPYIPVVRDVNQTAQFAAILIPDAAGDFAASVLASFTQPLDPDTLDFDDWTVNLGGDIISATIDPDAANVVSFGLAGAPIGISNPVDFTYTLGSPALAAAAPPDGTGAELQLGGTKTIRQLQAPLADGRTPAVMDGTGTLLMADGNPAPIGTKIYIYNSVPVANSVSAEHNGIRFSYRVDDPIYGPNGIADGNNGYQDPSIYCSYQGIAPLLSCESFTNWLHGIFPEVYLHRDECNQQIYTNYKTNTVIDDAEYANPSEVLKETIDVDFRNNRGITNITFQGTGENNDQTLRNGSMTTAWDVIRSNNGTLRQYYQSGFRYGGEPVIAGASVIDNNLGQFVFHATQPVSYFNGRNRLDGIDRPLIFIAEFPNGERCALSSLILSATTNDHSGEDTAGTAILFGATNASQTDDGTIDPIVVNFDLAQVGKKVIYPEWNIVCMDRARGVASSNRSLPEFPAGVDSDDVVIYNTSTLPSASPFEAATYWVDGQRDGIWTAADDYGGFMSSVAIDADQISNFRFTMTTQGIQLGNGITSLIGGYAVGFFNNATVPFLPTDFGVQIFGPELSQPAVFTSNPISGNNSRTTEGWLLVSVTDSFDTAEEFFTANAASDPNYIIVFRNLGRRTDLGTGSGTTTGSDVVINIRSADTVGPNDLAENGNEGAFVHYDN